MAQTVLWGPRSIADASRSRAVFAEQGERKTMQVRVLYFALLRERLRRTEETLDLPAGSLVRDAVARLAGENEVISGIAKSLLLAVNQTLVPADFPLHDGDELALLPPVSGGSEARLDPVPPSPRCRISRDPLDASEALAAVRGPGQGGVVLFIGLVRDHNQGKQVVRLDYEAFDSMAVRSLTTICDEIEASVAGARLAVIHRVGSLTIGDVAVLVAASAPHRAEAFAACRQAIERLKVEVPIWKKEFSPDGSEWLGGAG
jgi:molybdopterin synthase catalytic subunit